MSIELTVKEEELDDAVGGSDYCLDYSTKCGEMFLDRKGEHFTFVCSFCLGPFTKLSSFGEHLHQCRTSPKEEPSDGQTEIEVNYSTDPNHLDVLSVALHPENIEEIERISDLKDPIKLEDTENHTNEDSALMEDELHAESNIQNPSPKNVKSVRSSTEKKKSMKNPIVTRKFCCFSCGKLFLAKASVRNHYLAEHPDMIEKDDLIVRGVRKVHEFVPKVPSDMSCKFCLKTFHEPETFHSHIEFDHTDKIYSCDRCTATFRKSFARNYHVDAHDGKKRFQCPHCPAQFTHPSNRRNHIQIHLNKKKFSCRFCDRKYIRNVDLRIHERIHTKERPFQCEECGQSFIAQIKLTQHQRRHKNIKNYKCTQCDKAFFALGILKAHIITHTKDSPFGCDICQRKFRSLTSLRAHKMLHLDKKTFECKLCGKMFAQYAGLYSHMKSHDGVA